METTTTPTVEEAPKSEAQPFDGRAYLLKNLERGKDEIVKVTSIAAGVYRCNWYLPMVFGDSSRNGQITKSLAIRCTHEGEIMPLARQ